MSGQKPYREFLPFKKAENLLAFESASHRFTSPYSYHQEYEVTLLINAKGIKRSIGGHVHILDDIELFMAGPDVPHGWEGNSTTNEKAIQVTLNFTVKAARALKLSKFKRIKKMMAFSSQGLVFPKTTAMEVKGKIMGLKDGSEKKYLAAISDALQLMAKSHYQYLLPAAAQTGDPKFDILAKYIRKNYAKKITLADVASHLEMTQPTFNRYIKKHTGKTFVNFLNQARIAYAARMLTESDRSIAEVAAKSGYNNIANFNRIFKKGHNLTPLQYREKFYGSQYFI